MSEQKPTHTQTKCMQESFIVQLIKLRLFVVHYTLGRWRGVFPSKKPKMIHRQATLCLSLTWCDYILFYCTFHFIFSAFFSTNFMAQEQIIFSIIFRVLFFCSFFLALESTHPCACWSIYMCQERHRSLLQLLVCGMHFGQMIERQTNMWPLRSGQRNEKETKHICVKRNGIWWIRQIRQAHGNMNDCS